MTVSMLRYELKCPCGETVIRTENRKLSKCFECKRQRNNQKTKDRYHRIKNERLNEELLERLKFYHIRCINCDCLVDTIPKDTKTKKKYKCPDCKSLI